MAVDEWYLLDEPVHPRDWQKWVNSEEAIEWLYKAARTQEALEDLPEGYFNRAEIVDWEVHSDGLIHLVKVRFYRE